MEMTRKGSNGGQKKNERKKKKENPVSPPGGKRKVVTGLSRGDRACKAGEKRSPEKNSERVPKKT